MGERRDSDPGADAVTQPIRIFGAGVRGQVIADLIAWHFADRFRLDGFYDDGKPAGSPGPGGVPVLGPVAQALDELPGSGIAAFLALGTYRSWRNCEIWAALRSRQVDFPSLVAPTAIVSPSARIGSGAFVMGGCFVGAHAEIGHLFGANAGSVIEHHARIGNNVLLGSAVAIAGSGQVEDHCFVGTNSTVLPEVRIGAGSLVGAGSVVSRDIAPGSVAIGSPARVRRPVGEEDEVPGPARLAALAGLFDEVAA